MQVLLGHHLAILVFSLGVAVSVTIISIAIIIPPKAEHDVNFVVIGGTGGCDDKHLSR